MVQDDLTCWRQLSHSATTTEPVLLNLGAATTKAHMSYSPWSATREATAVRSQCTQLESSPVLLKLEKASAAMKNQHSQKQINKIIKKKKIPELLLHAKLCPQASGIDPCLPGAYILMEADRQQMDKSINIVTR